MQQPEPIIVPPMVRMPQIAPQVIEQRKQEYSVPLPPRQRATPRQFSPLSPRQRATPRQFSPLPQLYRPRQVVYSPSERCPVQVHEQSPWLVQPLPETPRPFSIASDTGQFAPIQVTPTNISLHISPIGMSASIPNILVGYSPSNVKHHEPGVAETLMGCATLFLVGIILLAILFYIVI